LQFIRAPDVASEVLPFHVVWGSDSQFAFESQKPIEGK